MESTNTPPWDGGEWELCNDDGFVYKRRKRNPNEAPQPDRKISSTDPEPAAAEARRRDRKRTTLLKLREQYRREIEQWEHLSNTLRAMEDTSLLQLPQTPSSSSLSLDDSSPSVGVPATTSVCGSVVDELLLQVEAQEAIIRDATNLCNIAEAMCNAQEEEDNQALIDLPVWAVSPRKLLASLCDH